jgi:hypothetical protein
MGAGGGGGSYLGAPGTLVDELSGVNAGDGEVTVDLVTASAPTPEPGTLALVGLGLVTICLARRYQALV